MERPGPDHDFRQFLASGGYHQLLDTAPDARVVLDRRSRIVFVNAPTETLFGHPRQDLLGHSLERLLPERFHAPYRLHLARCMEAPTVRQAGPGLSLLGLHRDGTEIPIEVFFTPLGEDGESFVSAVLRDLTERRSTEGQAELNASRLGSAIELVQDAFALFDVDDRLVLCNGAYRDLIAGTFSGSPLGRLYREILESGLDRLSFESDEAREQFLVERPSPREPHDVRTRDGRSLRISHRRLPEGGVVQTIRDRTEDVRREEELRRARLAAEASSAARSEFLSSVSHELRNPLNTILGFAQLLQHDRRERLSERQLDRVGQILRGGEELLRLLDDLLDPSRR